RTRCAALSAASPTGTQSPKPRTQKNTPPRRTAPCESVRLTSDVAPFSSPCTCSLLLNVETLVLWQHRCALCNRTIRPYDLARQRSIQPKLLRNPVDAFRLAQLCLRQPQLAVDFTQLLDLLLLRFHLVANLDRLNVLPYVGHRERKQENHRDREAPHLALAIRIVGLHNARVVDVFCKEHLRRRTATARALLLEHLPIALGDAGRTAVCRLHRLHPLHSLSRHRHRRHNVLHTAMLQTLAALNSCRSSTRPASATRAGAAV